MMATVRGTARLRLGREGTADKPPLFVRVGEEAEATPGEVPDISHVDTSSPQERVYLIDVLDVELNTSERARRGVDVAHLQRDRARRPGRLQLNEAMSIVDSHVLLNAEARLFDVERHGAVDVRHRDGDEFEAHVHAALPAGTRSRWRQDSTGWVMRSTNPHHWPGV